MMKQFMETAIKQAEKAFAEGEVPVGAVIVKDGRIIASAHNLCETEHDPTAHAEMVAIRRALADSNMRNLAGCEAYVTLEPCPMCAWALLTCRVSRIIYGAGEYEYGALGGRYNLAEKSFGPVEIIGGICEEKCAGLLREFFKEKRES